MNHLKRLASWLMRIWRVQHDYHWVTGRFLAISRPRLYTEKIQWRKLFGFEPSHAIYCDKLATRSFVESKGLGRHLSDLIWSGENIEQSPLRSLTFPCVIKSSHASGQTIIVRDPATADLKAIGRQTRDWLAVDYGDLMSEPGYFRLPRRLMIERMILKADGSRPHEHRVMVFGGKARIVITEVPTETGYCTQFHTAGWVRLNWKGLYPPYEPDLVRPKQLDAMIVAAEQLAGDDEHLRIDLYDLGDDFKIGEITVYSYSGLVNFAPRSADAELGAFWNFPHPFRRALARIARGTWAESGDDLRTGRHSGSGP